MSPLRRALYFALAAVSLGSIFVPKVALFVLLLSLVAGLSLPRERPRLFFGLTLLSGALSFAGFVRFLVVEAVPGIVQGGTTATEAAAVSRLREIVFAEDGMRKTALIDPDHDGIGSAALLGELTGALGLRGGEKLKLPVLERYTPPVDTRIGPAIEMGGYFFAVCLPAARGDFTARPGEPIDEERAERRFVAYAWPSVPGRGLDTAYFIDEHERILRARVREAGPDPHLLGPENTPRCDDALAPDSAKAWKVWRGKRPRPTLPGDRS